jgi:hypothetical protein
MSHAVSFDQPRAVTVTNGLEEGRRLRDVGVEQAGSGVPGFEASEWRAKAEESLGLLIHLGNTFTADDVVRLAGPPPHPNMLGGLFITAARSKRIVSVGYTQGQRKSAHSRVQKLWERAA